MNVASAIQEPVAALRRNRRVWRRRGGSTRTCRPSGGLPLGLDRRRFGGGTVRTARVRPDAGRTDRLCHPRHLARLLGDARNCRHHGDLAAEHDRAGAGDDRRHDLGDGLPEVRARLGHALGAVRGRPRRARAGDGACDRNRRECARYRDGADRTAVYPGGRTTDHICLVRRCRAAAAARRARAAGAVAYRTRRAGRGVRSRGSGSVAAAGCTRSCPFRSRSAPSS